MKKSLTIEQCRKCPHCRILPDPDPTDWFNDDDQKAICVHPQSIDDRKFGKDIEGMLRPYEKVDIPKWCPL